MKKQVNTNDFVKGQETLIKDLSKLFEIFKASGGEIRPHFVLTGPSGSGKSFTIQALAELLEIPYTEVNAAQLTKEGVSGNSLSKALGPLANHANKPVICFVDEFDKLFISGNSNSMCAHESTNGVQNEFLKVLESKETSIFADYGKYTPISVSNVLFIFAGAFNGEENIDIDRLREFGIKTEFLGRVGLVFNAGMLSLETLYNIFETSSLFKKYCSLFEGVDENKIRQEIKDKIKENYENNTLGARMINTLIHQYFVKGGFPEKAAETVTFQKKLTLTCEV